MGGGGGGGGEEEKPNIIEKNQDYKPNHIQLL